MSEPTLEEIVARLEKFTSMFVSGSMAAPLIASWRARGEALRQIAEGQMVGYEAQTIARAALAAEPASGDKP